MSDEVMDNEKNDPLVAYLRWWRTDSGQLRSDRMVQVDPHQYVNEQCKHLIQVRRLEAPFKKLPLR